MEVILPYFSLWGLIFFFLLMRKSLAPFLRWRNLLVLAVTIAFWNWWIKDLFFSSVLTNALNEIFPGGAYPFLDISSTVIVVAVVEEILDKGVPLFLLLLLLRLFNPGKPLKWVAFFATLLVANLFSIHEVEGYALTNSALFRCFVPIHFTLQMLTGYILYRYCQSSHRWIYLPFFFFFWTIALHFIHNLNAILPAEVFTYMVANPHYDLLHYAATTCYIIGAIFMETWALWLTLSVLAQQEGTFLFSRHIRRLEIFLQKYIKIRRWMPVVPVILVGAFIGVALHCYEHQEIKPAAYSQLQISSEIKNKKLVFKRAIIIIDDKKVNLDSLELPIIDFVRTHKIKHYYFFNPPVWRDARQLNTGYIRYTYPSSLRNYVTYKGVTVAIKKTKGYLWNGRP